MTTIEKQEAKNYAIEMHGITKKYPGTLALYRVDY